MRFLLALPILAAGCASGGISVPDEPQEPVSSEYYGEDADQVRQVLDSFHTSELGTERTRPVAKTIEWHKISTEVGTPYVAGKVSVDRIERLDSGDSYGSRVRLKNTTAEVLVLEYRFRFFTRRGGELVPFAGVSGDEEHWTGFVLEPFGVETVGDFSRIIGADGFRIFVRPRGGEGDGAPQEKQPE